MVDRAVDVARDSDVLRGGDVVPGSPRKPDVRPLVGTASSWVYCIARSTAHGRPLATSRSCQRALSAGSFASCLWAPIGGEGNRTNWLMMQEVRMEFANFAVDE